MIAVLDSNEYINFLNKKSLFVAKILENNAIKIYANETIVKEVLRNIDQSKKGELYRLLCRDNIIVKDEKMPYSLLKKYKNVGLKKGDIAIGAFCEHAKVDYLISENRHFLKELKQELFKVSTSKEFLDKCC